MQKITIGSRESKLAVIQAEIVLNHIRREHPEVETDLITMKTTGDKILDRRLDQIGGKGLFVKELDKALRDKRSDLSVHSLKDMPMEVPEDLPLIGFSDREDPRDVLVLPEGVTEWDQSKPVGCSSNRRILQLRMLYPHLKFESVRGNVQTRLSKLDSGQFGAIILAAAGLKRLGLEHRINRYFEPREMIPAAGQGILALQGRAGMDYSVLNDFLSEDGRDCALAERAFVKELDGGCTSPIAAHAILMGDMMTLSGLYCDEECTAVVKGAISGSRKNAEALGVALAQELAMKLWNKLCDRAQGEEIEWK